MNLRFTHWIALVLGALAASGIARASIALVNFDPPGTPIGPSIYVAVPAAQTIVTTPATFSGGVVLGDATFFPAIAFATAPNVYGTANFGNGLSDALTIAIDPAFFTTEVSFALFNGETFNQSYTVDAFNGANLVTSQTLTNVAPNFNSGAGLIDLNSAGGITKVTITPTGAPAAFDFLIDTVGFNQNISGVVTPPVVQPPTPPVEGHIHGHGEGEVEPVEVNFGDDINDIRGSTLLVPPSSPVPEPKTYMLALAGLLGCIVFRKKRQTV